MTSLKSSFNQYSVNQVMKSRQTSFPQLCKDKCQICWRWKKTYWKQGVLFHIPVQQTGTFFISIFLTRMTLTSMYSISPGSFGRVHRSMLGFSGGSVVKELECLCRQLRRCGSIPRLGRFPGEGNGNPLQYSCLENPMARGAWWAAVHSVAKSCTWLSNWARTHAHRSTYPEWH